MARPEGIEPSPTGLEAVVLPLYYVRSAQGGSRTRNIFFLREAPLPVGLPELTLLAAVQPRRQHFLPVMALNRYP